MALDTQVHVYSVGTGVFFTSKEQRLYNKLGKLKQEKKKLNESIKQVTNELSELGIESERGNSIYSLEYTIKAHICPVDELKEVEGKLVRVRELMSYKSRKTKLIVATKNKLLQILKSYLEENKKSKGKNIRKINEDFIGDKDVVSLFEGAVTRTIKAEEVDLTEDLIIVQVYYFDVLQDILLHGFIHKNQKYRFFTSSAGQIRKKKAVFIKEDVWNKHEKTFMCGLTIDKINEKGGMNVNKFLSYLALQNSATDIWEDFDIDRSIVVEDFETLVPAEVDYVDDKTYTVTRQKMDVPIPHTDGAGMISAEVSKKNFMIRLPWIKGLLGVFDFKEFILQKRLELNDMTIGVIKDIYGVEHDIIAEGIEVILTKSQFKLYKYYESWEQYKEYFKKYDCQACICNIEEDRIKNAKINYQMLQTLTNMSNEELNSLAVPSIEDLNNLTSSVENMLKAFNVTKYNKNKSAFQKSLELYPELLQDEYCKEKIREIKKSLVSQYRSGRLKIKGKYTFVLPDFYAFCEWLFLGEEVPKGILNGNEVSCKLFRDKKKLDCLRSPHLYREHFVTRNRVDETTKQWLNTDAIYTSTFSIISKVLQFDVDGDKLLVCTDETLVKVAERSLEEFGGIVPLYYNMKKADGQLLTPENLYNGLNAAFIGGNIGVISNDITKVWNSSVWVEGDENEKLDALKTIKLLCMDNNFTIDYAKTLYKPIPTEEAKKLYHRYVKNSKVPKFFYYAKGKEEGKVETNNNTVVNQLESMIKDKRLTFKISEFGKIDYKMLMANPDVEIDENIIEQYMSLNREYRYKLKIDEDGNSNESYVAIILKKKMNSNNYTEEEICDMLVKKLFSKKSNNKAILWLCYGDIIYENLKRNIGNKTNVCPKCGKRFEKTTNYAKFCKDCSTVKVAKITHKYIICEDCGKKVRVGAKNTKTVCCKECAADRRREKDRLRKLQKRK